MSAEQTAESMSYNSSNERGKCVVWSNTIEFLKISTSAPVVTHLRDVIVSRLSSGSVLWLVSGGSAVQIAVEVSRALKEHDLSGLTVTLADERFGEVGHADSNWQQLTAAGFSLPGATLIPVLTGDSLKKTVERWGTQLAELFESCDYSLGLLGIGPDGHTAGILPGSVAVAAKDPAVAYEGGGYTRITTTPAILGELDEVVVYAVGQSKAKALQDLQTDLSLAQQPAQLLKRIQQVTVYNDSKEGGAV